MKQSFRVSLGAVILALVTLAAVIFAILNFDQRARFESPDDGVAWRDTDHGVEAWRVSTTGPAWRAGDRGVQMDQRAGSFPSRQLRRVGLSDGSVPTCIDSTAAS